MLFENIMKSNHDEVLNSCRIMSLKGCYGEEEIEYIRHNHTKLNLENADIHTKVYTFGANELAMDYL